MASIIRIDTSVPDGTRTWRGGSGAGLTSSAGGGAGTAIGGAAGAGKFRVPGAGEFDADVATGVSAAVGFGAGAGAGVTVFTGFAAEDCLDISLAAGFGRVVATWALDCRSVAGAAVDV
jgi:hypothetical protein